MLKITMEGLLAYTYDKVMDSIRENISGRGREKMYHNIYF